MTYQWDALLLEAGFLAVFLGSEVVIVRLFRWQLCRLMFLSGTVKLLLADAAFAATAGLVFLSTPWVVSAGIGGVLILRRTVGSVASTGTAADPLLRGICYHIAPGADSAHRKLCVLQLSDDCDC
jgi:hypothetical protein